uniref:Uncharacterized protein n=1 Tax=Micrurus surinamensis TaxID=129470 RepID=A0A2D4PRS4_MICSU
MLSFHPVINSLGNASSQEILPVLFFPTFDICMLRKLKKEGRPRKTDLFSKPQIYGICLVFVPLFFSFIQCILKSFFIYCDRAYFLKEGEIHYYPNAVHSCN